MRLSWLIALGAMILVLGCTNEQYERDKEACRDAPSPRVCLRARGWQNMKDVPE
jgi:hypothetical protein